MKNDSNPIIRSEEVTIQPRTSKGWFTVYARSSVLFRMNHWFYPPHPDISSTRSFTL